MAMLQDALLKHNQQVPRYTSYPTAPHFSSAVGSARYASWLDDIADGSSLSLYFHIPYCRKLCWYCGCHTKATKQYRPVETYLDYLLKEIDLVRARLSGGQRVKHIHFGGGSPSILSPEDFAKIMDTLRSQFDIARNAEIAIELDPREASEAKIASYAKWGVNRVSLGVQDFHEKVQDAINRRQRFHTVYDTVQTLRDYGITSINMDLLYGLPHQTAAMVTENVDFAVALNPSRIALFGYAHVPWMKKHMRLIDETALPDSPERLAQFDAAETRLAKRGYTAIGLDHFVRAHDPMLKALNDRTLRRNFQGYTTDGADALIGFGVSSISSLPQGYVQNTAVNADYFTALDAGRLPATKGKALSNDDQLRRAIIDHLMCYFELDLGAFCAEHDIDIDYFEEAAPLLDELRSDGLIRVDGAMIKVPPSARQAVRLVCSAFDTYLQGGKQRHAQVA